MFDTVASITEQVNHNGEINHTPHNGNLSRFQVRRILNHLAENGEVVRAIDDHQRNYYLSVGEANIINLVGEAYYNKIQTPHKLDAETIRRLRPRMSKERVATLQALLKTRMIEPEDIYDMSSHLRDYLRRINQSVMLFLPVKDAETADHGQPKFLLAPYLTRQNNTRYYRTYNERVKNIFTNASRRSKYAVHLTVTVDPKKHQSNYHITMEAKRQVNSLLTNIKRQTFLRQGRRVKHFKAQEYTTSGLLHFHIVIFGKRYIKPVTKIAYSMWKLGGVDIYQLTNQKGIWTYPGSLPPDYQKKLITSRRKGKNGLWSNPKGQAHQAPAYFYFQNPRPKMKDNPNHGKEYWKEKLLASDLKNQSTYYQTQTLLHWAYNTRFSTYSRGLNILPEADERVTEWQYATTVSYDDILLMLRDIGYRWHGVIDQGNCYTQILDPTQGRTERSPPIGN